MRACPLWRSWARPPEETRNGVSGSTVLYKLDVIHGRFGTFLRTPRLRNLPATNVMLQQPGISSALTVDMLDGDPIAAQMGYYADAACRRPTSRAW